MLNETQKIVIFMRAISMATVTVTTEKSIATRVSPSRPAHAAARILRGSSMLTEKHNVAVFMDGDLDSDGDSDSNNDHGKINLDSRPTPAPVTCRGARFAEMINAE